VHGIRRIVWFLLILLAWPDAVRAGETDQYLTWDVQLEDSSGQINHFLNEEISRYLEKRNRIDAEPKAPHELVQGIYLHLFEGIYFSRLRGWLNHSPKIDRYPDKSVSFLKFQRMSIYRKPSFPFILPMARTVRIGDVYCGIDKLSHFFGFGRRYYRRYLRLRGKGAREEKAMDKVVLSGVFWENGLVGRLVDGIFSHADLEADFQGFLLARDLCEGKTPYIELIDGKWVLARHVDIRDYVTPDFDESFNPCHYWALRKRLVLPLLKREYGGAIQSPLVQKRFARYRQHKPSYSKRIIDAHFAADGRDPQAKQFAEAFGSAPGRNAVVEASRLSRESGSGMPSGPRHADARPATAAQAAGE
jgi:hypothetical protein